MIFLIALLSVAIVVLIGIIMVLSRKPVARRCQDAGPFSDQEQHDLASSFNSFSSTSAYDNLAFSEPRLHFMADDEIVSLEPSVSMGGSATGGRTAQERLFARRTAACSVQSPAPVARALPTVPTAGTSSRTTTTFTNNKPAGSTI